MFQLSDWHLSRYVSQTDRQGSSPVNITKGITSPNMRKGITSPTLQKVSPTSLHWFGRIYTQVEVTQPLFGLLPCLLLLLLLLHLLFLFILFRSKTTVQLPITFDFLGGNIQNPVNFRAFSKYRNSFDFSDLRMSSEVAMDVGGQDASLDSAFVENILKANKKVILK